MKSPAKGLARVLALTIIAAASAAASTMTISLNDGRKVSYDTRQIVSITYSDAGAPAASDEAVFTEDFRKGLSQTWEAFGVVGGDFGRFAKVESGRLAVSVPAGNSWGKTGIMSREPFVTVSEKPTRVRVEFDSDETTGVCIALSATRDLDIWRQQNAWLTWTKTSETEGSLWFGNTQNGSEQYGSLKTGREAPASITVTLAAGKASVSLPDGQKLEGSIGWLKPGTGAYFTVYSHPARQGAPVDMAVKAVKILR